jgi:hypothetical protein
MAVPAPGFIYQQQLKKIKTDLEGMSFAQKNISSKSVTYAKLCKKYQIPAKPFVTNMISELKALDLLFKNARAAYGLCNKIYETMAIVYPNDTKLKILNKKWNEKTSEYKKESNAFKTRALNLQRLIRLREEDLERRLKR